MKHERADREAAKPERHLRLAEACAVDPVDDHMGDEAQDDRGEPGQACGRRLLGEAAEDQANSEGAEKGPGRHDGEAVLLGVGGGHEDALSTDVRELVVSIAPGALRKAPAAVSPCGRLFAPVRGAIGREPCAEITACAPARAATSSRAAFRAAR